MRWRWKPGGLSRGAVLALVAASVVLVLGLITIPMLVVGGSGLLFESGSGCEAAQGAGGQPVASPDARDSIPANYLALFQEMGQRYGLPWVVLAGIGEVESDDGRSNLPGVHSAANAFGAAGPMQIGIGGAAGNEWGGAPVHPASEHVNGVATDGDGDGIASVYDPADAIAGAARFLVEHGVQSNVADAIFAYNHMDSYVQLVLSFAGTYAKGGFTISPVTVANVPGCVPGINTDAAGSVVPPNKTVATAISFAEAQLGKPYQWGATGPGSYDCSGLAQAAWASAGVSIPRTTYAQWAALPHISTSALEPGDLLYFDGVGHVAIYVGGGDIIDAPQTGQDVQKIPLAGWYKSELVGAARP